MKRDHTQQAEIYLEDLSDPDATKKAKAELKDRFGTGSFPS